MSTAAVARVLLILDASLRIGGQAVWDSEVSRLAYFVDAFCRLWMVPPLDRFRLKQDEPRSLAVKHGLDRLAFLGLAVPSSVSIIHDRHPQITARFELNGELARPVIDAIQMTEAGRRETNLVDEVVFAASGMSGDRLAGAFRLDASVANRELGPQDVIDLLNDAETTSAVAKRFAIGVLPGASREAQLTHLYLAHLDRILDDS